MAASGVAVTPIGFTGTEEGYNCGADLEHQGERGRTMFQWLVYLRAKLGRIEVHHGDCIGSDRDVHGQCLALGIPRVLHPPVNPSKRAFAHKIDGVGFTINASNTSMVLDPEPYLDRDWVIVDRTVILLATPKGRAEEIRSGTWATIRHARAAKRWIIIVYPDGTWQDEGPRPSWCLIPDEKLIEPDDLGHRWDGDWCIGCGFDATDAMAYGSKHPFPTCEEWRGTACLCRTGGAMICKACSDGEPPCQCRSCFGKA